ncbi:MAG: hypothetical protein AMS21_10030 [Gemmatimonas sp. SG8_38_2]|nr:MAG: hypothetical protein AMS21_10030 [Gemmatimonas sp. SG8_38_2]
MVAIAICLPVTPSYSQGTPAYTGIGIGASGGWVALGGDLFQDLRSALGAEVTARYTWPSNFQLLLGGHYSNHDLEELDAKLAVISVFADARYVLAMVNSERIAPYIGGRVAYVRLSPNDSSAGGSAGGPSFGGLVGFLFELVPRLSFEAYGYFGGLIIANAGDLPLESDEDTGNMTILQVGLVYTLPN